MKSASKIIRSTFTSTSSILPTGCAMDQFSSCNVIVVGLDSISNFLNTEKSIRFILAPRSHNALPISTPPIEQGIVELLRSFIFVGMHSCSMALHTCVNATILNSPIFFFLEKISLRNLTYEGICSNT